MQSHDTRHPYLHLLAENKLGAAPTLEIIVSCPRDDLPAFYDRLWNIIEQQQLIRMDGEARHLITHDRLLVKDFEPITVYSLSHAKNEFLRASEFGIRKQPATLLITGRREGDSALPFANLFRLSVGSNYFPDDPGVVSINLTATDTNAWASLLSFRDALLPCITPIFCWSTLGYGFVCNFGHLYGAAEQMQMLCMRYLGVDWQDPFGSFVIAQPWGIRSVNWQVCASPTWLAQQFPDYVEKLIQSAQEHLGYLLWQTGDKASLCDRNNINDHPLIAAYANLAHQLAAIMYVPDWHWYRRWDEATHERWSARWDEVQVCAEPPESIN
jgi:hypothetical protein